MRRLLGDKENAREKHSMSSRDFLVGVLFMDSSVSSSEKDHHDLLPLFMTLIIILFLVSYASGHTH